MYNTYLNFFPPAVCERVHKVAHTHARYGRSPVLLLLLLRDRCRVAAGLRLDLLRLFAPVFASLATKQEDPVVVAGHTTSVRFALGLSMDTRSTISLDAQTLLRFFVLLLYSLCVSCRAFPLHTHCTFSANFFIMNIAPSLSSHHHHHHHYFEVNCAAAWSTLHKTKGIIWSLLLVALVLPPLLLCIPLRLYASSPFPLALCTHFSLLVVSARVAVQVRESAVRLFTFFRVFFWLLFSSVIHKHTQRMGVRHGGVNEK